MASSAAYVSPVYMAPTALQALLLDPATAATTLVVDVRDEDFIGGNVFGALNVPSSEFRESIEEVRVAAQGKRVVIFHCALSQVRGPKCARIMAEAVHHQQLQFPTIAVLEGGFKGWAEHVSGIEADERSKVKAKLVAAYDKSYHGHAI